jgi:hypothetical protein
VETEVVASGVCARDVEKMLDQALALLRESASVELVAVRLERDLDRDRKWWIGSMLVSSLSACRRDRGGAVRRDVPVRGRQRLPPPIAGRGRLVGPRGGVWPRRHDDRRAGRGGSSRRISAVV